MVSFYLCACGTIKSGLVRDQPQLALCPCGKGAWRKLEPDEAAALFKLPPWDLTLYDLFLCVAFRIDPELPEVS